MITADWQKVVNDMWKPKKREIDPVKVKKKFFCVDCGKKGFLVKLDYCSNTREQCNYTVYDVQKFVCPRCGKIRLEKLRIEGKGKCGANAGKMFGSY